MFFDFLGIPGKSMTERSKIFCEKAKSSDSSGSWVFSVIVQYLQKLKERVEQKEISAGTMKNRYRPSSCSARCLIFLFHGKNL